jgi:hypothetical protein
MPTLAPKALRSTMETLILTPDEVNKWRVPPFQRPVRINAKVQAIAEEMKTSGLIPGMLTLGKLSKDPALYVADGQHRLEAFRISGIDEAIADVRIVHFDTMADMADEFVQLNTAIVRMRPDDILRGLAPTLPNLQRILTECPFVGYGNVRRGDLDSGPVVSISAVLRCWMAGAMETPTNSSNGMSINQIASTMDEESARRLVRFLNLAFDAWGRDPEYYRLWGACNLAVCMWLYRRLVMDKDRRGSYARVVVLNESQFKQCLMSLSAAPNYIDWLQGRLLNDRDRGPALTRIKQAFTKRLNEEGLAKVSLPAPAWASK